MSGDSASDAATSNDTPPSDGTPPSEATASAESSPAESAPDETGEPQDTTDEGSAGASEGSTRADERLSRYGNPGRPLDRSNPLRAGFLGGIGLLLAYGVYVALGQLSTTLTVIGVSVFLACGVEPIVDWLVRHRLPRVLAITIVFLGLVGIFAAFAAKIVPILVEEGGQLVTGLPDALGTLQQQPWFTDLDQRFSVVSNITDQVEKWAMAGGIQGLLGGIVGVGTALLTGFFNGFTVLVLTLFFTAGMRNLRRAVYGLVPASRRERVTLLGNEITKRIGGYIIGQIAVATLNAVCIYIVMLLLGINFAVVLAVTVGLLGLIPMIGATLGAVVVAVVAAFQSPQSAVIVIVYYIIYQQFENYVIAPRVMERTVSVPAVVTTVAALSGGALLGVLGALIAVPVAAAIMLVIQEVVYPAQDRR